MGSEIDDILLEIECEGFTKITILPIMLLNGRRIAKLCISDGTINYNNSNYHESTLHKGDVFNLRLSEGDSVKKETKPIMFRKLTTKEKRALR